MVDICCDDASSPHEQPSTELGSPEDLLRKGRAEMLRASDKWADEVADAIVGISDAKAIVRKIRDTFDDIDVRPYARALERKMVHGAALGAMDHALELGMLDAPSATAGAFGDSVLLSAFSEKAFKDAVGQFIKKNVVSRAVWDKLRAEIKRRSFTVAGIESQVMRQKIFQSLAQQIEKGADLREFKKTMIADLKAAGLIKSIPKKGVLSASHVDTVFRTNVLNSYNYGRYKHASQPKVIKAFPVWEIVSVIDGRERSAHAAANGKMLLATDPFWKRAYPPFGFNCRCRIRSRSAKYLSQVVSGSTITGLPDSGFTSGYNALVAA
jgi:SPP1 gp7 family putative phage head morphogenesis protein